MLQYIRGRGGRILVVGGRLRYETYDRVNANTATLRKGSVASLAEQEILSTAHTPAVPAAA